MFDTLKMLSIILIFQNMILICLIKNPLILIFQNFMNKILSSGQNIYLTIFQQIIHRYILNFVEFCFKKTAHIDQNRLYEPPNCLKPTLESSLTLAPPHTNTPQPYLDIWNFGPRTDFLPLGDSPNFVGILF